MSEPENGTPRGKADHLKEHQFQPGQSGNSAGRPPGIPNRAKNFSKYLPLTYKDKSGATRAQPFDMPDGAPLTVEEAIDLATIAEALGGNQTAAERIATAMYGKPSQLIGQDPDNPFPTQLPPVEVVIHVIGATPKDPA